MPSEITCKQYGSEYWVRLDEGLILICRYLRREKGSYVGTFYVTEEATGNTSWSNVQLASGLSRTSFLKQMTADGIVAQPAAGRLSDVCLLIDRLVREGRAPVVMVPRKPSADSWLVPRWMPLHATSVLYGAGGTGKSLLALYFGVCALTGRKCGPWSIAPVKRVLYLDWEEEDQTPHEERLWGILGPGGFPDLGEQMVHLAMDNSIADSIDHLRVIVDQGGFDLIIVDSLHVASGREIEGSEAARSSLDALRTLRGCSKLVVGHVPWAGIGQSEGIPKLYGSVFNQNLARSVIYLGEEIVSPDQKILTAHRSKANRGGPPTPVGFRLSFSEDPNSTDVLIDAHAPDLSQGPLGERIVAFLKTLPLGRETVTVIAEKLEAKEDSVKTVLNRMENRNKVVRLTVTAGGRSKEQLWGLADRNRNSEEA